MKHWTKEELNLLTNIRTDEDIRRVAATIGRTRDAVKIKANRLNIYTYRPIVKYHENIPLLIKSYLSGHFDGEGCIRMGKRYSGNLKVRLTITVSSANKESLLLYNKYFNGVVRPKKHFTNKPMFLWIISNLNDVHNFIESIIPYSIEKKPQLLLGKEWIERRLAERKTVSLSKEFNEYSSEVSTKFKFLKTL